MTTPFSSLDAVDVDGAIQEAGSRVDEQTRASFLRKAGIGLGALAGSGAILAALPSLASAAATTDVDILNFALTLEYLESAFYGEAVMKGALSGETKTFAKVVAGHEAAHVAALKGALGARRGREAEVRLQRNDREPGEVPGHLRGTRVHRRQRLPRPGRQHHLQEGARRRRIDPPGRGLARRLDRRPPPPRRQAYPAPMAFATGKTMAQILAAVKGTGFIVG